MAVEQPDRLGLAVAADDRQIAGSPLAIIGASRLLAAKAGEIVHGCSSMIA
jgi:hypothetical protein